MKDKEKDINEIIESKGAKMVENIEEYLNNYFKGAKKPSLHAMQYFMKEYDNFEKDMKFIHIAGTNGKGSCTEMITNILVKQGYKVGKFISPHLIKYNERISINNINISDEDLRKLIKELEPKINRYNKENNIDVTLFELETTMALLYFYRNNVDFVVLETGLGGLYDCTNVITKPLVSIITSIGYDHIQILGNTLTEIAAQKAGIIKENSNTVIFENNQEVDEVFIKTCKEKNNKLSIIREKDIKNYHYDKDYQYFDYKNYKNIAVNLKGICQVHNGAICIETINILNQMGYIVEEKNLRSGLSTVIHRGRMEVINKNPLIIYDGGHNEAAIKNLKVTIDMYYKELNKVFIISILKRKDYNKILELLMQDKDATFILTSGNSDERYTSGEALYKVAKKYKKENQKIYVESLDNAIKEACGNNQKNTVTFVVGSFYIYGDVIRIIEKQ